MTLNTFLSQAWRFVRLGSVAALAGSQAATHVRTQDTKLVILIGAVAGAEVLYRAFVPAKDQTKLATLVKQFRAFLSSPQGQAVAKVAETELPKP